MGVFTRDQSRARLFGLLWLLSLLAFWRWLKLLSALALQDERYSYVLFIPLISAGLIYLDRRRIFGEIRYAPVPGVFLAAVAVGFYIAAARGPASNSANPELWPVVLGIVFAWTALFVGVYGAESAKRALFPLAFLLLMVPMPARVADGVIVFLQHRSADLTYVLFKLLRVPVLRHSVLFSLPGIDIEVARECSGIRSSMALLITGILAAHLFLRSAWKKLWFVLFIIPVAVFKNAIRIVTLSYLGVYVDRSFLMGQLHHRGGVLFALVGVAALLPVLLLLRRLEDRALNGAGSSS